MTIENRDWVNDEILPYLPSDRVRQGDKIIFRCPICGDSKKNANKRRGYYYLKSASYHCFNCDISLSGMKLLQILSGEEYEDIKSKFFKTMFDGKHFRNLSMHETFNDVEKSGNILQVKNVVKPEWKKPLSEKATEYLKNRLVLDAPFLKEPLYSYFSKNGGEYILIPWKMNGVDAYFQINDFQKLNKNGLKYIFPKDREKLIYGLDNIDMSFPYLICFEGVYDSLFIPNGIAIGGKNLTNLQSSILKKRFPNHKVVLALDNDKPGLIATGRALERPTTSRALFFKWFDQNTKPKDINDMVKAENNVNIFRDESYVESLIVDSITMKMWLSKQGLLESRDKHGKAEQFKQKGEVQQRPHWDVFPDTPRKVQG